MRAAFNQSLEVKTLDFTSEEEQYDEKLSREKKERIKDSELRAIRLKYSDMIRKNHEDEHRLDDDEVQDEWRRLVQREKEEIEAYKKRRGIS